MEWAPNPPYCPGVHTKRGNWDAGRWGEHHVNMKVIWRMCLPAKKGKAMPANKPPEAKRPGTESCLVPSEET